MTRIHFKTSFCHSRSLSGFDGKAGILKIPDQARLAEALAKRVGDDSWVLR